MGATLRLVRKVLRLRVVERGDDAGLFHVDRGEGLQLRLVEEVVRVVFQEHLLGLVLAGGRGRLRRRAVGLEGRVGVWRRRVVRSH